MDSNYLFDLRERIANAMKSNMPEESKLIFWGEILNASSRGDITINQGEELEVLMQIDKKKYWRAFEIATFGHEVGGQHPK